MAELTPRKLRAAEALVAGASHHMAAASVGMSGRTLRRWLQDPEFIGVLESLRRIAFDEAMGLLRASALDAVRSLRSVLSDGHAPAPARVTAARAILELAVRSHEMNEIEGRIEQLERCAAGRRDRAA